MQSTPAEQVRSQVLDRFTELVRDTLAVPAALVCTPEGDYRQIFALIAGEREPVAITDLRTDDRIDDRISTAPLTGLTGLAGRPGPPVACLGIGVRAGQETVAVLCAVDTSPRPWDERDRHVLTGLAAACSAELTLHDSQARATAGMARAEQSAVASRQSEMQARLLLALSEALTDTTTVASVTSVVQRVAAEHLSVQTAAITLNSAPPGVAVHRSGSADAELEPGHTGPDGTVRLALPLSLTLSGGMAGALTLTWSSDVTALTAGDGPLLPAQAREVLRALAHYTSTALERAILLQERRNAATTLQHALLTTLPEREDVQLAARYIPAAAANQVGGDWYDALALPPVAGDGLPSDLAVVIGDIAGHDIEAAATMGQVRSVLRGLLVDRPQAPAEMMTRLDSALANLAISTGMSAVLGILGPVPHEPRRKRLRWANAGHPKPLLITADGETSLLGGHSDLLLGMPYHLDRHTQEHHFSPGDTLVLYTDGLVQRADRRISIGQKQLAEAAREHHRLPLAEMLSRILEEMVDDETDDDCAVLAVRLGPSG